MDFALSLDDALEAAGRGGLASLAPGRRRPPRHEERHLREAA